MMLAEAGESGTPAYAGLSHRFQKPNVTLILAEHPCDIIAFSVMTFSHVLHFAAAFHDPIRMSTYSLHHRPIFGRRVTS